MHKNLRLHRRRKFGSTLEKPNRSVSLTGLASPNFEKDCTKFNEDVLGNGVFVVDFNKHSAEYKVLWRISE